MFAMPKIVSRVGPAVETSLLEQFVDSAVEALDHAVRLRMGRRRCPATMEVQAASKACLPLGFFSLVANAR
jgi:hypothetical protein